MSRLDAEKQHKAEFIPPHSLESEMALLGSLLVSQEHFPLIAGMLDYEDFYAHIHASIYRAIAKVYFRDQHPDKVLVAQELRVLGELERCGGIAYLSSLMESVQTASTVVYHAKIIREKATLRRLMQAGREIFDLGLSGESDVESALSGASNALLGAVEKHAQAEIVPPPTLGELYAQSLDRPSLKFGMRYGFSSMDHRTMGMQPRQITTIGARTGAGKSALAEHIALAAGTTHSVLYVPLEMGHEYTTDRFCARLANRPINEFMRSRGSVPVEIDKIFNVRIVSDERARSLRAIESLVSAVHPDLVIIDHAAHIDGWYDSSKRADLGPKIILQKLHDLVMRTGIHLLILQQLSREADGQKPSLKDLRDTGAFEEISTRVLLLHHPFEQFPENDNIVEIFAAKDRAAGKRMYHAKWTAQMMAFGELDAEIAASPPCCMPMMEMTKRRRRAG